MKIVKMKITLIAVAAIICIGILPGYGQTKNQQSEDRLSKMALNLIASNDTVERHLKVFDELDFDVIQ